MRDLALRVQGEFAAWDSLPVFFLQAVVVLGLVGAFWLLVGDALEAFGGQP